MLRTLSCILFIVGLSACSSSEKAEITPSKTQKVLVLADSLIYSGDDVRYFLSQKGGEQAKGKALFLNALDAYRNQKNSAEAVVGFKKSIVTFPSSTSYFELGNALLDEKKYEEALLAYEMAEKLSYEPFASVLYSKSCAYSLLEETDLAANYLEYALQAGYTNLEHIQKDPDLANLRGNYRFDYALKKGIEGMSNPEKLFWIQFKKRFANSQLPLTIDAGMKKPLLNDETQISYEFEKYITEMRNAKFSREVSEGYYHFVQLAEKDNFAALIYIAKEEFMGENAPLRYILATYSPSGKLIDKLEIAGRELFDEALKTVVISKNLTLKVSYFETTFSKDPSEFGYENNPIKSKRKVNEKNFQIDALGKIVLLNEQLSDSDVKMESERS